MICYTHESEQWLQSYGMWKNAKMLGFRDEKVNPNESRSGLHANRGERRRTLYPPESDLEPPERMRAPRRRRGGGPVRCGGAGRRRSSGTTGGVGDVKAAAR